MARLTVMLLALLLVVAASLAMSLLDSQQAPDPMQQAITLSAGQTLGTPRQLEEFQLVDAAGQAFGRERLKGQWNLAFIGFTHCPDVCPMTLSLLEHLSIRLDDHEVALQPVFVSVDPERDTPEELARYSSYFGDRVVAATGQRQQLQRFCDSLDFAWVKVPMGQGNYTIDHSGALALVDPQARLVGYFLPPLDLEAIEIDLIRLAAVM
jgi:protein SCO1